MWDRFMSIGSSLCGAIVYFILLSVLFGTTATKRWALFDSDHMAISIFLLVCVLIPWLILAFGSKGFDDYQIESTDWKYLFGLYFIPGIIPFCLGGVLIVGPPVAVIIFFLIWVGAD